MENITIQADEEMVAALKKIAEHNSISIEGVARNALIQYLQSFEKQSKTYSFIGIGKSGKKNISTQAFKPL
jgi:predicted transcriptional regulator